MKHKIYCFNNGGSPGWLHAIAIGHDGHVVGQHICSHESYMRHDLGMDGSTWKHEQYDEQYGAGNWECEWVENPKEHVELNEAFRLNQELKLDIPEEVL